MIPVLYNSAGFEDNDEFVTLGKGKLVDVISCKVEEEINGDFSLTMEYPLTGALFEDLKQGGIIGAACPIYANQYVIGTRLYKGLEFFDIYSYDLPIDGVVTFRARHISRRIAESVKCATSFTPTTLFTASDFYPNSGAGTGLNTKFWGVYRVNYPTIPGTPTIQLSAPKSLLTCIYGAEESISALGYEIRAYTSQITVSGNKRLALNFVRQTAIDRGAWIRFGGNMLDLQYTSNSAQAYNALVPYWTDGSGVHHYTTNYVVQPTTPPSGDVVALPYDCTSDFSTQPTSAQMVTLAKEILDSAKPWLPQASLEVDFINNARIEKGSESFYLGDTVSVLWGDAAIEDKRRVVKTDFNVLTETYNSITLGDKEAEFVAVTGDVGSGGETVAQTVNFTTDTKTSAKQTLNSGAATTVTLSIAKTGYTPLALTGFRALNGSDGTYSTLIYFSQARISGATFYATIRNGGSSQAITYIEATVLYKQT